MRLKKKDLRKFEKEISESFLDKKIGVPIHLSGGNEERLIDVFKLINKNDWVFSTHRNHYHVLLKGMPQEKLNQIILDGESMHIYDNSLKIFTSSIVCGSIPIALGVAMGIKRKGLNNKVWMFVGDMAAEMGVFHECTKYAKRHDLPIVFIVEDNGLSTDTPTQEAWGESKNKGIIIRYKYSREWNHVGPGKDGENIWVTF